VGRFAGKTSEVSAVSSSIVADNKLFCSFTVMNITRILLVVLVLGSATTTNAQSILPKATNDSLWAVWNDTRQADTSRLKAMHDIAREGYVFSKPDSGFFYAQIELDLATKKGLHKEMAAALNTQGISFIFRRDFDKALNLFSQSLGASVKIKDTISMAKAYTNMALVHDKKGDIPLALEYNRKAVDLQERIGDESGMALTYNNIGNILMALGDIKQALQYHQSSLKVVEKLGDRKGMATSLGNIGIIHSGQGEWKQALEYFEQGLEIAEELGYKNFIASASHNIGDLHRGRRELELALPYYQRELQALQEMGNVRNYAMAYNGIGGVYYAMMQYDLAAEYCQKSLDAAELTENTGELATACNGLAMIALRQGSAERALPYAKRSMELAQELGFPEKIKNAAKTLSEIYRAKGQYKETLEMYTLYIDMRDSTISQANKREVIHQKFQYEFDKKEALAAAEQEKKDAIAEEHLHRREVYLTAATGITFLLGIMSLMAFLAYRAKSKINVVLEKKNKLIEAQKKEITDSIQYAENIQRALLPQTDVLKAIFPDSFILFSPKDVVSGDFYWMTQKDGITYIAVGDCTGHGVPGAMLSVIGLNSLNRCVSDLNLRRPKDVLMQMTLDMLVTFEGSSSQVRDGMDIALCAIDLKAGKLSYAGANNPLWIARNGEMLILKATRRAVGYHDGPLTFEQEEMEIEQGDVIYLSSDGFQDQMGGLRGKKYMTKNFREHLIAISQQSASEQYDNLLKEFTNWRGSEDQTDDVCVVGVRLG